jgi:hypothetical protein
MCNENMFYRTRSILLALPVGEHTRSNETGQSGKLSPVQIQSVVDPLRFAFGLPPALPEPYHVLAEVWQHAAQPR